jgi:hypothetical protein
VRIRWAVGGSWWIISMASGGGVAAGVVGLGETFAGFEAA